MSDPVFCTHTRADGTPCRAMAIRGTGLCFWHSPASEPERATRTPRSASVGPPLLSEEVALETPDDVQRLLTAVANHLATAEQPDTTRAHTLGTVAGVLLRAVRLRDLQREVAQLTAELEQTRRLNADLERALTYARQDVQTYGRTIASLRDQLYAMRRPVEEAP